MKTTKKDAKKATKSEKSSKSGQKVSKRLQVEDLKDVKAGCTFGDKTSCST